MELGRAPERAHAVVVGHGLHPALEVLRDGRDDAVLVRGRRAVGVEAAAAVARQQDMRRDVADVVAPDADLLDELEEREDREAAERRAAAPVVGDARGLDVGDEGVLVPRSLRPRANADVPGARSACAVTPKTGLPLSAFFSASSATRAW